MKKCDCKELQAEASEDNDLPSVIRGLSAQLFVISFSRLTHRTDDVICCCCWLSGDKAHVSWRSAESSICHLTWREQTTVMLKVCYYLESTTLERKWVICEMGPWLWTPHCNRNAPKFEIHFHFILFIHFILFFFLFRSIRSLCRQLSWKKRRIQFMCDFQQH